MKPPSIFLLIIILMIFLIIKTWGFQFPGLGLRTLDIGLLKKYNHDPLVSDFEVAMGDEQRYIVEAIKKYRIKGSKRSKKAYEFLVKFEGYEDPEWQTYRHLTHIDVFKNYCRDKQLSLFY